MAEDQLQKCLGALQIADAGDANCASAVEQTLSLLETQGDNKEAAVKALVDGGALRALSKALESGAGAEKTAQLVAEIAKIENVRIPCVDSGLVEPLVRQMEAPQVAVVTQACRALGNICFDNDMGREEVDRHNGLTSLINLMKAQLNSSQDGAPKLRMVLCGFLLNLTNTHGLHLSSCNVVNKAPMSPTESDSMRMITLRLKLNPNASQESMQEKAINLGCMELLEQYIQTHHSDDTVCQMALMCVGSLADSEAGRDKLCDCEIAVSISDLLGTAAGDELQDSILELLANLAESDEVKAQLAGCELKNSLIRLLRDTERAEDEDTLATQKLAADLLVLLLTGDPSMDILYEEGNGAVYKESLSWLQSPSEHLRMSGALAVGNFARNDNHCMQLVREGVTDKLLLMLKQPDVVPTVQHAVFSALRNMAIPKENKARMVESDVLGVALPYIREDFTAVQFKLLGLLRMLTDGQVAAAKTLGCKDEFMTRLVEWCAVEDHAGVKGEANRLVAWLVKHSRNAEVMRAVVAHGATPHLVNMVNAEHAVMQNEALVALTLIATTILGECDQIIFDSDLVATLKVQLTEDDTLPEIICNVFTLIKALAASNVLKEQMKIAEMKSVIKGLSSHEDEKVKSQIKEMKGIFDKG